jgi:hypothetical protein
VLQRYTGGQWLTLDSDTAKFEVTDNGTVYSLGDDGWLNINGSRVWGGTADFALGSDQTVYWQSSSGVLAQLRAGTWSLVDSGVTRFALRDDGLVYSLDSAGWLSINGGAVWNGTQDFAFGEDQSLYWHASNGALLRLSNQGWQTVDLGVSEFAVRHDGVAYTLTTAGRVNVAGVHGWSNVRDLSLTNNGCLVIENTSGATQQVAGRFAVSRDMVAGPASVNGQSVQTSAASTQAIASFSLQAVASAHASYAAQVQEMAVADRAHDEAYSGTWSDFGIKRSSLAMNGAQSLAARTTVATEVQTVASDASSAWDSYFADSDDFSNATDELDSAVTSAADTLFDEIGV